MRNAKYFGFTLIELLVVISIIGVLMALLLPAVNAAREAARVAQCSNSQRQLAIAINTMTATKDEYPGWLQKVYSAASTTETDVVTSWVVPLLPNLEQVALYEKFRSGDIVAGHIVPIPFLVCPSSGLERNKGVCSYVANCGVPDLFNGKVFTPASAIGFDPKGTANGVFVEKYDGDQKVTNDTFNKDGKSNTVLFSENLQTVYWVDATDNDTVRGFDDDGNLILWENQVGFCWPIPSGIDAGANANTFNSQPFELDKTGAASGTFVPFAVNIDKDYVISTRPDRNYYRYARPSAGHTGIIVMSFADASTRNVSDTVDDTLLKKIMCPQDAKSFMKESDRESILDSSAL